MRTHICVLVEKRCTSSHMSSAHANIMKEEGSSFVTERRGITKFRSRSVSVFLQPVKMTTEYAYCQSTSAPLAGVGPHKGSHGKPCLIVAVRGTPPLRLGRLECGLCVLPGSSMKTPKVGLGYHPFKRVVMRCRARDEKRQEMSLPVTNPGLMESSRKGRRCAGERKPGCSWNCTCRTWVLAPTGCMRKGDPIWGYGIRSGPGLTLSGSRWF